MTNEELIAKIKVEIERLKTFYGELHTDFICEKLLSLLSDIESKKPIEELEKEIQKYLESKGVGYGGWIDGWKDEDLREIARHFAQWQKDQMASEAIEATIDNTAYPTRLWFNTYLSEYSNNDKVRIIIVKE